MCLQFSHSKLKMPKSTTCEATVVLTLSVVLFLSILYVAMFLAIIAPDPTISAIRYTVDCMVCVMKQLNTCGVDCLISPAMFVWHYWVAAVEAFVLLAANCTIAIAHSINS